MSEQNTHELSPKGISRRRFLRRSAGVAGFLAVSVDWPGTIQAVAQQFRDPSIRAQPVAVPPDQPVYRTDRALQRTDVAVKTIFASDAEYQRAIEHITASTSLAEVKQAAEQAMFAKFAARVAIGSTTKRREWEAYALEEAERITGMPIERLPAPARQIEAVYGTPDLEAAIYAGTRTCTAGAPIPLALLNQSGIQESAYVAGLTLRTPYFEKTVRNGVSAPTFGGLIVDCMNRDGTLRRGVGTQWLHQFGFFADHLTTGTPTTFNDMEMAQLIPGLEDMSQERLDYPGADDVAVFDIASTKAQRFKEILSGQLILPDSPDFDTPEQSQQELLLRRLYGTFPEVPATYFEDITLYRQDHDDTLPAWGGQLAA